MTITEIYDEYSKLYMNNSSLTDEQDEHEYDEYSKLYMKSSPLTDEQEEYKKKEKEYAIELGDFFASNLIFSNIDKNAFDDFFQKCSKEAQTNRRKYADVWLGAAGFFSVIHLIEKTLKDGNIQGSDELTSELLQRPEIKKYLYLFYNINITWNLVFYRSGTTSYIFLGKRADDYKPRIFKIIKPRYSKNNKISLQTSQYQVFQPDTDDTPDIHSSNINCIEMEYLKGKSLKELNIYLLQSEKDIKSQNDLSLTEKYNYYKIKALSTVITKVVSALEDLYEKYDGEAHRDINPGNIIVQRFPEFNTRKALMSLSDKDLDKIKIKLIDFGKNYLLEDDFGATNAVASVLVYASPEIVNGENDTDYRADIYSLGILILEILSNQEKFDGKKLETYRKSLREKNPIIASLLNEMLIENSVKRFDSRFHKTVDNEEGNPYTYLSHLLSIEFDIITSRLKPSSDGGFIKRLNWFGRLILGDFAGIIGTIFDDNKIITEAYKEEPKIQNPYRNKLKSNIKRSYLSSLSNLVVITAFGLFFSKYYGSSNFWAYLPGLVICGAFAPLAHTYYMNIFSQVSVLTKGYLSKAVELWLWLCTFYYMPIIITFYYFFPNKWPLATFIGTLIIAVNNTLHYYLTKQSLYAMNARLIETNHTAQPINSQPKSKFRLLFSKLELEDEALESDLKDFSVWQLMYPFSIPMLLLYLLLSTTYVTDWTVNGIPIKLYDEIAYASIIFLIIIKLYLENNKRLGPKLCNFLQYCYCEYSKTIYLDKQTKS
jgi:hypothetical protein